MYYTVSDFYNLYRNRTTLLCGSGGLSRQISSVGLIDYEFSTELKERYRHLAGGEGKLSVTSLQFAKDNDFLVDEAVKDLVRRGSAGLVIKNVFGLPLHETTVRYAEAKNFPIFLLESPDTSMEEVLFAVRTGAERMNAMEKTKMEMDQLLAHREDEEAVRQHVWRINPSLVNQYYVVYAPLSRYALGSSEADCLARYVGSDLDTPETLLVLTDDGLFFVVSWRPAGELSQKEVLDKLLHEVLQESSLRPMGVSDTHYRIEEMGRAMVEAVYGAAYAEQYPEKGIVAYRDLGEYRVLFPFCRSYQMQQLAKEILEPLEEYDAENKGHLEETLMVVCEKGGNLEVAAKALGGHVNTVRYRLGKIGELTGMDIRDPGSMRKLDLAYRIRQAEKMLAQMNLPDSFL